MQSPQHLPPRALVMPVVLCSLAACGLELSGTLASSGARPDGTGVVNDAGHEPWTTDADAEEDASDDGDAFVNPTGNESDGGEDVDAAATDEHCGDGGASWGPRSNVKLSVPTDSSPEVGGSGTSNPFDDKCPTGMALVGIDTVAATFDPFSLSQVQGICAPITREPCAVTLGTHKAMPNRGTTTGTAASALCPEGNVVVGIRPISGSFVDSIALDCAPLTFDPITGQFPFGTVTTTARVGGPGGNHDPPFACPSSMVVSEIAGQTGTLLDRLSVVCATPAIP